MALALEYRMSEFRGVYDIVATTRCHMDDWIDLCEQIRLAGAIVRGSHVDHQVRLWFCWCFTASATNLMTDRRFFPRRYLSQLEPGGKQDHPCRIEARRVKVKHSSRASKSSTKTFQSVIGKPRLPVKRARTHGAGKMSSLILNLTCTSSDPPGGPSVLCRLGTTMDG